MFTVNTYNCVQRTVHNGCYYSIIVYSWGNCSPIVLSG